MGNTQKGAGNSERGRELAERGGELAERGGDLVERGGELIERGGNSKISWRGSFQNGELPYAPSANHQRKYNDLLRSGRAKDLK